MYWDPKTKFILTFSSTEGNAKVLSGFQKDELARVGTGMVGVGGCRGWRYLIREKLVKIGVAGNEASKRRL